MSELAFHEDDLQPRRLDWGLWRRILVHALPYKRH